MKKTTEANAELETAIVTPPADGLCVPNKDGVFENPERFLLNGMPVKTGGELRIAPWKNAEGRVEFCVGYFLFIRPSPQCPENHAELKPSIASTYLFSREDALKWLVEEIAEKFFFGHKAALEKLRAWWAARPENPKRSEGRSQKPEAPAKAEKELPAAAEVARSLEPAESGNVSMRYANVALDDIERNPANPREEIEEAELAELAESIKAPGFLLHAIVVRELHDGSGAGPRYRLIAGERRWRAHRLLNWPTVETKIFSGCSDELVDELALIENLQRRDLNAIEEAKGFSNLRDKHGYTVEKIVERTGKSERAIQYALGLLKLPTDICELVRRNELSATHARVLATPRWLSRPEHLARVAYFMRDHGVPVHELQGLSISCRVLDMLREQELAVDIEDYRAEFDWQAAEAVVTAEHGRLWHLDPKQWAIEKAELDRAEREKKKMVKVKAAARVEAGTESKVNLRLEDLKASRRAHVALVGDLARYEPHLPAECLSFAIDADDKEIAVCMEPDELDRLRHREAELLLSDRLAKLAPLHVRATEHLRKLKKIGEREMALLAGLAAEGPFWSGGAPLVAKAWEMQGLGSDEDHHTGLTDAKLYTLAIWEPLEVGRVTIQAALLAAQSVGSQWERHMLKFILREDCKVAADSAEGREEILHQASREVFPVVTTDPAILAEWVKAQALGMPAAEIARSYGVPLADVCGALGVAMPAA